MAGAEAHVVRAGVVRGEVVGDEHVGEPPLALWPVQDPQDTLGDKLVERARDLVASADQPPAPE